MSSREALPLSPHFLPWDYLKTTPFIISNGIAVSWCEHYLDQAHHVTIMDVLVLPMQEARIIWTENLHATVVSMETPFSILLQWHMIDYFFFFFFFFFSLHSFGQSFNPIYIEIYPKPQIITSPEPANKKGVSKMNVWTNTKLMGSFNMCTGTFEFCLH